MSKTKKAVEEPVISFGDTAETKDEARLKLNELYQKRNDKELELKNAELDTDRLFQAGRQLFGNACDYIKTVIIPVHKDDAVLGDYSKLLEDMIDVLELWAEGIGIGHSVDWDEMQQRFDAIKEKTETLFKKEVEYKKGKVEPLKAEVAQIRKDVSVQESKIPRV